MKRKSELQLIFLYESLLNIYGEIPCPLLHSTSFQLLIAVILSAQCTDKKVNATTPLLFKNYPDASSFAVGKQEDIEKIIRPIGIFRNKAKNLIAASIIIENKFGGCVPETMEGLLSLPGVGRKTANVVLGNAFGLPGFPVDTHVKRLMNRIGLVKSSKPEEIEKFVIMSLNPKYWTNFSHLLIFHGRKRCKASRPDCAKCEIFTQCERNGVEKS